MSLTLITHSIDQRSSLRVELPEGSKWSAVELEARVDLGHGLFSARNVDVQLLKISDFCRDLDRFIMDRSISPCINGTYGSFIRLSGSACWTHLSFCVGDAFACSRRGSNEFRLCGAFDFEQELLGEMLAFWRALAAASGR